MLGPKQPHLRCFNVIFCACDKFPKVELQKDYGFIYMHFDEAWRTVEPLFNARQPTTLKVPLNLLKFMLGSLYLFTLNIDWLVRWLLLG